MSSSLPNPSVSFPRPSPSPENAESGVLDPTKHPLCSGIDLGEDRGLLWSVLTKRAKGPGWLYIAGWRFQGDARTNVSELVEKGYRVALCNQTRLIFDSLLGEIPLSSREKLG